MSDVINLDEKRIEKKYGKELLWLVPAPAAETRFNRAYSVFGIYSNLGKRRQRDFLYEILARYYLERRPISVDEMAEMMISYIRKNQKYLERVTGDSMTFDFDKVPDADEMLRTLSMGMPKPK